MYQVDLNCDLGESFGRYTLGLDDQVIPYISSANVACGYHASDPVVMAKTVAMAKANGVSVGAHPGFPDLMGFGRRNMVCSPEEAKAYVMYQIGALDAFCKANSIPMTHVKPHGALYNMAGKDIELSRAICEGIKEINPDLILLGLSGSKMLIAAEELGLRCAKEVFADRAYEEDGSLRARTKEGSMITDEDEAIARVIRMIKEGKVRTYSGKDIPIQADSVCVHGDGAKALEFVKKIRQALLDEGIEIVSLRDQFEGKCSGETVKIPANEKMTAEVLTDDSAEVLSEEPAVSISDISAEMLDRFLDLTTYKDRLELFQGWEASADDALLDSVAVSLDITVEGTTKEKYRQILQCLKTMEHFETDRFR